MNKRELKALCSLTTKSVDELVVSKNIDLRHTQPVFITNESLGSDVNTGVKIIIKSGPRFFDEALDEYFIDEDDHKFHPIANLTTLSICTNGVIKEKAITSANIDNYEVCPFLGQCQSVLDVGMKTYFMKSEAHEYGDKHICHYAAVNFMKECSICHEFHPDWSMEKVNGEWVCEKCLESEIYAICGYSNKRFMRSEGHFVDSMLVSQETFDNHCIYDDVFTHEYHLDYNMARLPEGKYAYIPAIEASGMYAKCSVCGKYYQIDNVSSDADGYLYCKRCTKAAVYGYHSWDGEYIPLELEGENAEVFFGIELELAGDPINAHLVNRMLGDIMHCEHDASIDPDEGGGFEIITQPMSWNYLKSRFPEIKELFKKLQGRKMKGHDTSCCGLHVHVTRSYFKKTIDKNGKKELTAEMFADALVNEKFAENMQTFARRRSSNYYRYRQMNGNITKEKAISMHYNSVGHGVSVNFANKNTVEFRMFKSTLNPETYMACVEMVKNITEMANLMTTSNKRVVMWHELAKGEYITNYITQQVNRYGKQFNDVRLDVQAWNIEEVKTILKFKRDFIANLKYVNEHSLIPISMNMLKKAGVI